MKVLLPFVLLSTASIMQSHAVVVWADDFSAARTGTLPNDYSYSSDGTPDYNIRTGNTVSLQPPGYLQVQDASTSPGFSALVTTSQWTALPREGDQIILSYSIRVSNITAATAASVPRFGVVQNSTNQDLHNGGGSLFNIGFSYANFDGVAGNELAFYSTGDVTNVPSANAIGYSGGTGGTWAQGFNFGPYNAGASGTASIYTGAPSGSQWYNITIILTEGSNAVTGSITQDGTSNTATFNRTLTSVLDFSDLTNTNDGFRIFTGDGGLANVDFDNLKVEIIPEPSAVLLGAAAGMAGLLRRRRSA